MASNRVEQGVLIVLGRPLGPLGNDHEQRIEHLRPAGAPHLARVGLGRVLRFLGLGRGFRGGGHDRFGRLGLGGGRVGGFSRFGRGRRGMRLDRDLGLTGADSREQRVDVGEAGVATFVGVGSRNELAGDGFLGLGLDHVDRPGRVRHVDDLGRELVRFVPERLAFGRGACLDLRERTRRLEEGSLHDPVRVEETVASRTQRLDLSLQQAPAAREIREHTLASDLRLVEHVAALLTRAASMISSASCSAR